MLRILGQTLCVADKTKYALRGYIKMFMPPVKVFEDRLFLYYLTDIPDEDAEEGEGVVTNVTVRLYNTYDEISSVVIEWGYYVGTVMTPDGHLVHCYVSVDFDEEQKLGCYL